MTDISVPTTPVIELPIRGGAWTRADAGQLNDMEPVNAATACAKLYGLGIRRSFIEGPRPLTAGQKVIGSALTLQFMPQREDLGSGTGQV